MDGKGEGFRPAVKKKNVIEPDLNKLAAEEPVSIELLCKYNSAYHSVFCNWHGSIMKDEKKSRSSRSLDLVCLLRALTTAPLCVSGLDFLISC